MSNLIGTIFGSGLDERVADTAQKRRELGAAHARHAGFIEFKVTYGRSASTSLTEAASCSSASSPSCSTSGHRYEAAAVAFYVDHNVQDFTIESSS